MDGPDPQDPVEIPACSADLDSRGPHTKFWPLWPGQLKWDRLSVDVPGLEPRRGRLRERFMEDD